MRSLMIVACLFGCLIRLWAGDPSPRQFSTHYLDLGQGGIVRAVAADQGGNLFVVSTVLSGNAQTIVISKTDLKGNVISTFAFGGSGQDQPEAAAIDPNGDLVIGGATTSDDFPLVSALQNNGSGFLTKLDSQLHGIRYSTRLGTPVVNGVLNGVSAIAFDSAGSVYVTGTAGPGMPVTPGAFQGQAPTSGSAAILSYGFVAEVAAAGNKLIFSTYYTGTQTGGVSSAGIGAVFVSTAPSSIALDSSGNVIIAGTTDTNDLPVTAGAYAAQCGCGYQQSAGFVAKIGNSGTELIWGTYLPLADPSGYKGAGFLTGVGIANMALDHSGNIVLAGSTLQGFPATANALQPNYPPVNGASPSAPQAGFVAKMDASGSKLLYGTYFGGNNVGPLLRQTGVGGLAIDGQGTIWITGASASTALPTQPDAVLGSNYLAGLAPDGAAVAELYTAPAGAASSGIAITPQGEIAVIGYPNSLLIAQSAEGPSVMGVTGSASFHVSPWVAPRELIGIYGIGIGPATPQPAQIRDGVISKSLAGVQVLFDGTPAALLYAGPSQINAIVPTEIAARSRTALQIVTPAGTLAGPTLIVQPTVPQVFADIFGHAMAVNQDGTLNSASNPAAMGSIVAVYMTGAGDVIGGRPDDQINTSLNDNPFPISVLSSANAEGGGLLSLEVLYDGDAPLQPSGVSQINFRLPAATRLPVGGGALSFQIGAGTSVSDSYSLYVK